MFRRSDKTYDLGEKTVDYILEDEANPLKRICQIIPNNSKILDIGAGNGILAIVLNKTHGNLVIDGIEPNPYAANIACKNYRFFFRGFAHEFKDKIAKENYDFIIFADVIEHMSDPTSYLLNLFSNLPENTKIILTAPNIAFGAVRISLLNGTFEYVDSGIIEKTHLRFFTLKSLKQLVSDTNLNIETLYFLQRNFFNTEINLKAYSVSFFCINKILRDDLASTYQFLLVLSKKKVKTEIKYFGTRTKYSLLDHLLMKYIFR